MAVRIIVPIGTKFGILTVIGEADPFVRPDGRKDSRSLVRCECGVECFVRNDSLKSGNTSSCGCSRGEEKHGKRNSVEYATWKRIKDRCTNTKNPKYASYGGRGIAVCERWKNSFLAFLEDMGPRPSANHSIDRFPDNDGNYEKSNCRWATVVEQANNTRTNRLFTFYGKTMTMAQWCHIAQIDQGVVSDRLIKLGWSEKEAFWRPVRCLKKRQTIN